MNAPQRISEDIQTYCLDRDEMEEHNSILRPDARWGGWDGQEIITTTPHAEEAGRAWGGVDIQYLHRQIEQSDGRKTA